MRTLLDLEAGTDFNAYDADLATYAGITPSANVQSLLAAADYAAMKVLLDLEIGTDLQAWSAILDTVTGGTYAGDNSIVTVGTVAAGVWQGTPIVAAYIGADLTPANFGAAQTYAEGDLIDLSAITMSVGIDEGIALPTYADVAPGVEKYYMAYDAAGNRIMVREAGGWVDTSAGTGAPTTAHYVVTAAHAALSDESVLTEGAAIDVTDAGGDGGAVTVAWDSTEVEATTWGAGGNASNIWTFNLSGTDHTMTFASGLVTFSHAVTVTGAITGPLTVVDSTDATSFIAMFDAATGSESPKTDGGLTYNATTGILTATGFSGPLTGDVTGALTGNADTATALAADGADCAAGSYPLGVDASGAVVNCTDATTEIDSAIATHAAVVIVPSLGGTGVANNDASTLTISGNFATTLTVSGITALTLPTSGTVTALGPSIGAAEVDADVATQAELDAVAALVDTDDEIIAIINTSPATYIDVAAGGTGIGAGTQWGLPYFSTTGQMASTAAGAANTVLHGNGAGAPTFSAVVEADITLADNTTNDVSITKHGFVPKATNTGTAFLRDDATWATPVGAGDVVGPGSSTDHALARFHLATGKIIQNSAIIVDDSDNVSGVGTFSAGAAGFTIDADGDTNLGAGKIYSVDTEPIHPQNVIYVPIGGDIQTYVTAATAGDTLVLSAGNYTITSTITINKQLNIYGQGNAGLYSVTETDIHGTRIQCATDNIAIFTITSSNVRLAHMSLYHSAGGTSPGAHGVAVTATDLDGLVFTNLDVVMPSSAGDKRAFSIYGSTALFRDVAFYIISTNKTAYGVYAYNDSSSTLAAIIDAHTTSGTVDGGAGDAVAYYLYNDNVATTITMNLFAAYGTSLSGTADDNAAMVDSATTTNATMNIYQSTMNGADYDVENNGANTLNVYGGMFVNNTTNGTITYGGTVAASTFTGTIQNATNTAITNDDATSAEMYPTWVTANTGNLPQKTSSTKLTWNPSSGTLGATVFSDGVAQLTAGSITSLVAVNSVLAAELSQLENLHKQALRPLLD
jgi:hypothetical protein